MSNERPRNTHRPTRIDRRAFLSASAALGAGTPSAWRCPARRAPRPPSRSASSTSGPRLDYGYNYSMDQGRLFLEKALKVKTLSQENIPETAEVVRVMEKMIRWRLRDHLPHQLRLPRPRHRPR